MKFGMRLCIPLGQNVADLLKILEAIENVTEALFDRALEYKTNPDTRRSLYVCIRQTIAANCIFTVANAAVNRYSNAILALNLGRRFRKVYKYIWPIGPTSTNTQQFARQCLIFQF